MHRRATLSALMLLFVVCAAFAASPAGRWGGSLNAGGMTFDVIYTLVADGDELSGQVNFVGMGEAPFSGGTIRGDSVFFVVDAGGQADPLRLEQDLEDQLDVGPRALEEFADLFGVERGLRVGGRLRGLLDQQGSAATLRAAPKAAPGR